MKIKVLGSFGSEGQGQRPSAFLVDDKVLVDAGTVGGGLTPAEQIEVEYALVSHAHFDHIAGLAFLTDTLAMISPEPRAAARGTAHALARTSGHLTPEMLKREIDKAPPDIPVWMYHVKPQLYQETAEELAKVDSTRIHILEQGKTYTL